MTRAERLFRAALLGLFVVMCCAQIAIRFGGPL